MDLVKVDFALRLIELGIFILRLHFAQGKLITTIISKCQRLISVFPNILLHFLLAMSVQGTSRGKGCSRTSRICWTNGTFWISGK